MKLLNVLDEIARDITYFIDTETWYHDDGEIKPAEELDDNEVKRKAKQIAVEVINKLSNALIEEL